MGAHRRRLRAALLVLEHRRHALRDARDRGAPPAHPRARRRRRRARPRAPAQPVPLRERDDRGERARVRRRRARLHRHVRPRGHVQLCRLPRARERPGARPVPLTRLVATLTRGAGDRAAAHHLPRRAGPRLDDAHGAPDDAAHDQRRRRLARLPARAPAGPVPPLARDPPPLARHAAPRTRQPPPRARRRLGHRRAGARHAPAVVRGQRAEPALRGERREGGERVQRLGRAVLMMVSLKTVLVVLFRDES